MSTHSTYSDKLVTDFRTLINDTEALVQATTAQAGDKISDIRNRAQEAANKVKPQLADLQSTVVERAKSTAAATEHYVQQHPWATVGIATAVGMLPGMLIGRR